MLVSGKVIPSAIMSLLFGSVAVARQDAGP